MKYFFTILLLAFFAINIHAQIVLTKEDLISKVNMPSNKANYSLSNVTDPNTISQINAIAAKNGQGQIWDLSVFHFDIIDTSITTILAGTSGAAGADDPKLAGSNYVFKINTYGDTNHLTWDFFTSNNQGGYSNGETTESYGTLTDKIIYDPPFLSFGWPIHYGGAKWLQVAMDSTITYNGIPVKIHQEISEEVDGEGTLIRTSPIPQTNCLRLKSATMTKIGPVLGQNYYDTSYSYAFVNNADYDLATLIPQHTSANPLFAQYFNVKPDVTESAQILLSSVQDEGANSFAIQNSPNPFSSETTIKYFLANASYIKIVVHDLLGKEITILRNGYTDAGNHSVNFNASKLPAGCYSYTITANGMNQTKQMVIVR